MDLRERMDQLLARLQKFRDESPEVTQKLLEAHESMKTIEEHLNGVRKETKSINRERCEQEQINAGLSFELEQIYEKQKMIVEKTLVVEQQANLSAENFKDALAKYQERIEKKNESLSDQAERLKEQISKLS